MKKWEEEEYAYMPKNNRFQKLKRKQPQVFDATMKGLIEQQIEEVLAMQGMEQIWDESPLVQQERAKAKAEGQLKEARTFVLAVVNTRFPALTELAREKVASMTLPEAMRALVEQVAVAPNEDTVRWLLSQ